MGFDPAYVLRQRPDEGRRLVEIGEEMANAVRRAEFEALAELFKTTWDGLVQLARLIARRPTL